VDRSCHRCTIAMGDKTLDVRKSNWSWCVTMGKMVDGWHEQIDVNEKRRKVKVAR